MLAEEALFGADARHERDQQEQSDRDAGPAAKRESPADHVDDHSEIAGIANDAVDSAGFEFVVGLNGDQSAEAAAEHEDGIQAKRAAECVNEHADPACRFAVDGPEADAIGVGRDDGARERDHAEGDEDPAIGAILFFAGAEV